MFDLFGVNKISAREAVQELMTGATRGLLEGYEYRLEQKNYEIAKLNEEIGKLKNELEVVDVIKKEVVELKEKLKNVQAD